MTHVSKDVEILISHPFCLPFGSAPINRFQRRATLEVVAKTLGDNWELFDIDGILPAVMKKRKDVLLRHKPVDNQYMLDYAVNLNKPHEAVRKVASVTHSCYMWDFGLCAVDVVITLRINTPDALLSVYPFAEAFEEGMLAKELYMPPGFTSWSQVQASFSKAFSAAGLRSIHWLKSPDAPSYLLETCCWNLIMVEDKAEGVFAPMDTLKKSLEEFCGKAATSECFETGVAEYFASHTGYSGNVVIMINQDEAWRAHWLYKAVAILYSALMESAEPCYDLVSELVEGTTAKSIAEIRLVQKIVDLLHAEAHPIVVCSESFDAEIYDKVWNCWDGYAIDNFIDKRTEFLMHTLADISEQKSQNLQMRLNFVVFILTLVSVASTVAAIIDLLDVDDKTAQTRAVILAILTGLIGFACAVVVAIDLAGFLSRCRRASSSTPSSAKVSGDRASVRRRSSARRASGGGRAGSIKGAEVTIRQIGDE